MRHSIEVSLLSGLLATHLGADPKLARRAGLLHDIGKALTHEVEGSHVTIGADLCRRYHEPPEVLNAIMYHHGEEEATCLEAVLVAAADAISASRPGARKETVEMYIKRLQSLEELATTFPGVEKAFAIQAGREIRVIVRPTEIDDVGASALARDIAAKIEQELEVSRDRSRSRCSARPAWWSTRGDRVKSAVYRGCRRASPGGAIAGDRLPGLRRAHAADVVIANGENSAGGMGLTAGTAAELFAAGVDVLTGGNHVWHNREAYDLLDSEPRMLRPANFPPGVPGRGAAVRETASGAQIGVLNLQGRVFMQELDDPFRIGRQQAAVLRAERARGDRGYARRGDVREDRHGLVPRRPGERRRGHAHARADRRRAHLAGGHRVHHRRGDDGPARRCHRDGA